MSVCVCVRCASVCASGCACACVCVCASLIEQRENCKGGRQKVRCAVLHSD